MQIINKQAQWLGDIAIQQTGSFETLFELAALNDLSITERLTVGSLLESMQPVDRRVVNYITRNGIIPATEIAEDAMQGIEFWYVEFDFVVS